MFGLTTPLLQLCPIFLLSSSLSPEFSPSLPPPFSFLEILLIPTVPVFLLPLPSFHLPRSLSFLLRQREIRNWGRGGKRREESKKGKEQKGEQGQEKGMKREVKGRGGGKEERRAEGELLDLEREI